MASSTFWRATRGGWSLGGLLLACLLVVAAQQAGQQPSQTVKRFEYKYSFKPPYLAQKDGSVPFFEYFGSKLIIWAKLLCVRTGLFDVT
jgi:hypothetical protein